MVRVTDGVALADLAEQESSLSSGSGAVWSGGGERGNLEEAVQDGRFDDRGAVSALSSDRSGGGEQTVVMDGAGRRGGGPPRKKNRLKKIWRRVVGSGTSSAGGGGQSSTGDGAQVLSSV